MLRNTAAKIAWVGRTASMVFGLALVLALLFGVTSMTLAGTGVGAAFNLGKLNTVNRMSQLVGNIDNPMLRIDNNSAGTNATALDLQVEPGRAPMKVNSSTLVANLNADQVDGRDPGVFGVERVSLESSHSSASSREVSVTCPAGKVLVGTGYDLIGGKSGAFPNEESDVVVDQVIPSSGAVINVSVQAYEAEPTDAVWSVKAYAICATAG